MRIGIVAWCGIGVIILGYLMLRLMVYVNPVVPPLLIAVAVVYLLNPLVSALERRGVPRVAGAGIVYVLFLCIVALVISLLVPVVARQVTQVIDHFPDYLADAQATIRRVAARFGQEPDFRLDAEQVREWLSAGENRQAVTRYLTGLRSVTNSVISGLIIFVLGPVMAFYLLVDLPRLRRGAMALIPPGRREEIRGLMDRIGQAVGGFFRGQLLVALFVGVASSIGLWAIGLPFWLLVGMVAGVFNLVPLVGPFIGGGLAVIIALVSGEPLKAVWAALVLLAVQQIDNHLISPNVMGRTVQLHPVVVMLALLVGASFAGLFGMLVIVPLVAVAKIVFLFMWSKYVDYGDELTQGDPERIRSSRAVTASAQPWPAGRRGDDHRGGGVAVGRPGAVGDQEHGPDHLGELEVGRAVADGGRPGRVEAAAGQVGGGRAGLADPGREQVVGVGRAGAEVRVGAAQAAVVEQPRPAQPAAGQQGVGGGRVDLAAEQEGAPAAEVPGGVRLDPAGEVLQHRGQGARPLQGLGRAVAQVAGGLAPDQLDLPAPDQHRAQLGDGVAGPEQAARLPELLGRAARDQHHLQPGPVGGDQRLGRGQGGPAVQVGQQRPVPADQRPVDVGEEQRRGGAGRAAARRRPGPAPARYSDAATGSARRRR